jgi:hypothetical protein
MFNWRLKKEQTWLFHICTSMSRKDDRLLKKEEAFGIRVRVRVCHEKMIVDALSLCRVDKLFPLENPSLSQFTIWV